MEVVTMLNNMYTAFDQISEQHNVYKVSLLQQEPKFMACDTEKWQTIINKALLVVPVTFNLLPTVFNLWVNLK